MSKLQGEILAFPKMSGNVGAKTINIGGQGGDDGATFIPSVSTDGIISWENDKDLPNPEPVNIKGVKGDKGDKGDKGKDGYTPQKGTDYFTEADRAEIVAGTVANIPTASTDIKGLVKVGDGLAMNGDVLSVHDNWELITSITTTEEINSIFITQDKSGNALTLKKAIVQVITPAASEKRPFVIFCNNEYMLYSPHLVGDSESITTLWLEIVNNRILLKQHGSGPNVTAGQSYGTGVYTGALFIEEANDINVVHVYGVNEAIMPIGSKIEIWGVRA